jgi:hypothetical protein
MVQIKHPPNASDFVPTDFSFSPKVTTAFIRTLSNSTLGRVVSVTKVEHQMYTHTRARVHTHTHTHTHTHIHSVHVWPNVMIELGFTIQS